GTRLPGPDQGDVLWRQPQAAAPAGGGTHQSSLQAGDPSLRCAGVAGLAPHDGSPRPVVSLLKAGVSGAYRCGRRPPRQAPVLTMSTRLVRTGASTALARRDSGRSSGQASRRRNQSPSIGTALRLGPPSRLLMPEATYTV